MKIVDLPFRYVTESRWHSSLRMKLYYIVLLCQVAQQCKDETNTITELTLLQTMRERLNETIRLESLTQAYTPIQVWMHGWING